MPQLGAPELAPPGHNTLSLLTSRKGVLSQHSGRLHALNKHPLRVGGITYLKLFNEINIHDNGTPRNSSPTRAQQRWEMQLN
ncbi:hypothetical protein J6590_061425 [Homalodisca vitripennis]|nr:hypothetical protein J6590_061425 [Homalodisca vitripennis]